MRASAIGLVLAQLACIIGVRSLRAADGTTRQDSVIRTREIVRIGSIEGPYTDFETFDALLVFGDRVYVPQKTEVRVFDKRGRYITTIGRQGNGPGEYRGIFALGHMQDSLWVADAGNLRLTLYAPDFRVARTISLQGRSLRPMGLLANGRIWFRSVIERNVSEWDGSYDERMGRLDTLHVTDIRHRNLVITDATGSMTTGQPLPDDDMVRISPDGTSIVIVRRNVPGVASVEKRSLSTPPSWNTRLRIAKKPTNAGAGQKFFDDYLMAVGEAAGPSLKKKLSDALFIPEYVPPVSAIAFDVNGSVWIREGSLDETEHRWREIDRAGEGRRILVVPKLFKPMIFVSDGVWGRAIDDDHVSYVVFRQYTGGRQ